MDKDAAESVTTPKKGRGRWRNSEATANVSPLKDPQRGDIVWAKVPNHCWWPAVIVNKEDCGALAEIGGKKTTYFVYWYGHGTVSPIALSRVVDFKLGYPKFMLSNGKESFKHGVYSAISDISSINQDDWSMDEAFKWAVKGFPILSKEHLNIQETRRGTLSQYVQDKLINLKMKYSVDNSDSRLDASMQFEHRSEKKDLLQSIQEGTTAIDDVCLACVSLVNTSSEHPLFSGSICNECKGKYSERSFSIGFDLVAYHCSICMNMGEMLVCSIPACYRAYCTRCITNKAADGAIDDIFEADLWECFLCTPYLPKVHGLLKPRTSSWKRNMWNLAHYGFNSEKLEKVPLRILCFDGSCDTAFAVLLVLKYLDIAVETLLLCNFEDSDVEKLQPVLAKNVAHLKTPEHYQNLEFLSEIFPIHIVIATNKATDIEEFGSNFFLFFDIISSIKILNYCQAQEPILPVMWVYEAAPASWKEYNILISRYLSFDPAIWSEYLLERDASSLVWTNVWLLWPFLKGDGIPETPHEDLRRLLKFPGMKQGGNQVRGSAFFKSSRTLRSSGVRTWHQGKK